MSIVKVTREDALELFEALGITAAEKWNTKRLTAKVSAIDEMVDDDVKLKGKADKTLTILLEAIRAEDEIQIVTDTTPDAAPAKTKPEKPAKDPKPEKAAKGKTAGPVTFESLKARYDAGELTAKEFQAERKAMREAAKANPAPAATSPATGKGAASGKPLAGAKDPKPEKPAKAGKTAPAEPKKAAKAAKPEKPAKEPKVKAEKPEKKPRVRDMKTRPYFTGVVLKKHGIDKGVTPEMVEDLNRLYGVVNDRESDAQLRWAIHVVKGYVAKPTE